MHMALRPHPKYISVNPPDFEDGTALIDGIRWYMTQEDEIYTAGCRNITFRDIQLQKKRNIAFCFEMGENNYLRSYYPNAEVPVESNFVFDNISCDDALEVYVDIYYKGELDYEKDSYGYVKIYTSDPDQIRRKYILTSADKKALDAFEK